MHMLKAPKQCSQDPEKMPGMIYTIYRNNRFELKVARHIAIQLMAVYFLQKKHHSTRSLQTRDKWAAQHA